MGDVSEPADVDDLLEAAHEHDDPSIVVNNAGIGSCGSIDEAALETGVDLVAETIRRIGSMND